MSMKVFIQLFLVYSGLVAAMPQPGRLGGNLEARDADLLKRALSPDGTCGYKEAGANRGYTCYPGYCCSQYGWCGSSTGHCASGCQLAFGTCGWYTAPIPTTTIRYGTWAMAVSTPGPMSNEESEINEVTEGGRPVALNGGTTRQSRGWGNQFSTGKSSTGMSQWLKSHKERLP
ncbi:hypothetical protein EX30DRAFT_349993 [Ascodesmis nigricans]|uniref:Chitin-binding type-1 domain-containing protein n=1 Tax=Ascodesmis nigricans TaxID=341454 RepID=A0A4S2MTG9_9PEZI|nr:hypothetical protein EX30DRAFT_349993 [Ascodesmis nigricans]